MYWIYAILKNGRQSSEPPGTRSRIFSISEQEMKTFSIYRIHVIVILDF